jgi:hypothetical protein
MHKRYNTQTFEHSPVFHHINKKLSGPLETFSPNGVTKICVATPTPWAARVFVFVFYCKEENSLLLF